MCLVKLNLLCIQLNGHSHPPTFSPDISQLQIPLPHRTFPFPCLTVETLAGANEIVESCNNQKGLELQLHPLVQNRVGLVSAIFTHETKLAEGIVQQVFVLPKTAGGNVQYDVHGGAMSWICLLVSNISPSSMQLPFKFDKA
jgi:hypothetical protein